MRIQKFLIAGGNPTLLVWGVSLWQKKTLVKDYLGEVEQIGFADDQRLVMMGNELCINATLAFASVLGKKGQLKTSGLSDLIKFSNFKSPVLNFTLPYIKIDNIILFEGIGFICSNSIKYQNKKALTKLSQKYNLPAFGVISFLENRINPLVYVKDTDSVFLESACGSGSIAYSIFSGFKRIIHPTGQAILVRQRGDQFTVSARVVKIGDEYVD